MKKISEMTEQEIRNLSEADIEKMIKLAKAEAGIKLLEKPVEPKLINIPSPTALVYKCDLFGNNLVFSSMAELQAIVDLVSKSVTKTAIDYDWNINVDGGAYAYYINKNAKFANQLNVSSQKVYPALVYESLKDTITANKAEKSAYDKVYKEYKETLELSKEIESEIRGVYSQVVSKYRHLNNLCTKMLNDYLPLAEENEVIAIGFLKKAYSLSEEEVQYVLDNYKTMF